MRRAPNRRPSDAGPEKHQKSFRRVGESFLDGIRVAHKRLQEHFPPVWRVPKIGKKRRFDTFVGQFFAFRKSQNVVNYSIFAFYRLLREPCKNEENAVNPPAPKVLGRDLPDGTRKRLPVYLGGGHFSAKTSCF